MAQPNPVLYADVQQAALEKVRNKLQVYFETTDRISGLIGKGEVETISSKLYRIPIMLYRGGTYQKFNADNGDMGSGTGMKIDKLTAGFIYSDYCIEWSLETQDTTSKPGQAIVNAVAKQISEAMMEVKAYDDIFFHGDGTGLVTNASSGYASSTVDTYTFAGSTDNLGINKLREGMTVTVWGNSSTKRATVPSGGVYITNINYSTKAVTLSGTVTSGQTGDLFAVGNITSDSSYATGQSTWPLAGDTFRHGIYYSNDSTTTNYYLGQLKSTISQLLPANFNAGGSGVSFAQGQILLDQLIQRRDPDVTKGLIGIAHMSQRSAIQQLGVNISNWFRKDGGGGKSLDLQPSNNEYTDTFEFCGVTCYLSKRQDRSRMDFINPKLWGRAQLGNTDFYTVGGKSIFEGRTSTGTLRAAQQSFVIQKFDYVNYDPGSGGYISNLAVPSGY